MGSEGGLEGVVFRTRRAALPSFLVPSAASNSREHLRRVERDTP